MAEERTFKNSKLEEIDGTRLTPDEQKTLEAMRDYARYSSSSGFLCRAPDILFGTTYRDEVREDVESAYKIIKQLGEKYPNFNLYTPEVDEQLQVFMKFFTSNSLF